MMKVASCVTTEGGRGRRQRGFTLIELLVVVIIIGVLAAIAIPVYLGERDKAKEALLKSNGRSVCIYARTYMLDNLSKVYNRNAGTPGGPAYQLAATQYVSNAIEASIEAGVSEHNAESFVNPYSNKSSIVNWGSVINASYTPPAVFITNAGSCRYASFAGNQHLRGTVVVCWNTLASINAVQIYYVTGNGQKGPLLSSIALNQ